MSTYVFMRILESAPSRYDLGLRIITLGSVDRFYKLLARKIKRGDRVLDIGCGTGALAILAARAGANVKGIDASAGMLEVAEKKASQEKLSDLITFVEMGIGELEAEKDNSYDIVTCGLCFSELSDSEIEFALKQIYRLLKPGGIFLLADEITPKNPVKRILSLMVKLPLAALAYVITQASTRALKHFPEKLEEAGFKSVKPYTNRLGNFAGFEARKDAPQGEFK